MPPDCSWHWQSGTAAGGPLPHQAGYDDDNQGVHLSQNHAGVLLLWRFEPDNDEHADGAESLHHDEGPLRW